MCIVSNAIVAMDGNDMNMTMCPNARGRECYVQCSTKYADGIMIRNRRIKPNSQYMQQVARSIEVK
jgi:hypothetical protein